MKNLRQFLSALREEDEVWDITCEVDPYLEIAEIHRCVAEENGPVLLFHNVKGSPFPVVTNLFGSKKRVELAFSNRPDQVIKDLIELMTAFPLSSSTFWKKRGTLKQLGNLGTKRTYRAPVLDTSCDDLEKLPFLQLWPEDGGHFLTLPLVYTEPPDNGPPNLGMYRIQRFGKKETGLHFQIQKGGGFHFHQAEQKNLPLPVTIFLGGPPALILSAIAPLPENVPELLLAGLLQGGKLKTVRCRETTHPLIGECEFAIVGEAPPHVRKPEGPFGDHYGYYSLKHDFPTFNLKKIYHRKDAIYPATVVGKPRQEDFYIGDYLQELLSPIFPIVMPGVKQLWSYGETGFHSLSAAVVKERFHRECMTSAFRILGEGQLSLTKFLLLTDQDIDVRNFPLLLQTILERFDPKRDLFIFANLCFDTLDYTGPKLNEGSRGVMVGIGEKIRDLPTEIRADNAKPFCPGCLVVQDEKDFSKFKNWPLVILVDNVDETLQNFLWTVFTRFEPAADISSDFAVHRHHLSYELPIVIDARMKSSYPAVVECDHNTKKLVSERWKEYSASKI